ncbi:MAG: hypothetical protein OEQ47_04060 [Acidimicrobiia bacterium]|nr:hypothetical protein [Acidimicrobiia bacterium]
MVIDKAVVKRRRSRRIDLDDRQCVARKAALAAATWFGRVTEGTWPVSSKIVISEIGIDAASCSA